MYLSSLLLNLSHRTTVIESLEVFVFFFVLSSLNPQELLFVGWSSNVKEKLLASKTICNSVLCNDQYEEFHCKQKKNEDWEDWDQAMTLKVTDMKPFQVNQRLRIETFWICWEFRISLKILKTYLKKKKKKKKEAILKTNLFNRL